MVVQLLHFGPILFHVGIHVLLLSHNNVLILDYDIYFHVEPNVNRFDTLIGTIQIDHELMQIRQFVDQLLWQVLPPVLISIFIYFTYVFIWKDKEFQIIYSQF